MIKIKRRFNTRAVSILVLLTLALSIHVASPCNASLVVTHAVPVTAAPQTLSTVYTGNVFPSAIIVPYSGVVRFLIAQSDIPEVLIPSVGPSAEPTFSQSTPTPQPTKVTTDVNKNTTTKNSTGTGFDLGKIVGNISPFFIIALIPLLFVIGALFYFFFMGDQERRVSDEGRERRVSDQDQEGYSESINANEETGWREL
ncbi:MAG: hypothetical protein ACXV6K_02860 [Halobacteriota archaeon]